MKKLNHPARWATLAAMTLTLALAAPSPGKAASGGWGLGFDGTDGYVQIGAGPISPPWTATFWVKRENSPTGSAALLNDSDTALKLEQWPGTRKVGFTHFGVDDYLFDYTAPTGTWTHLAFVGTTSNTTLYANGVPVDTHGTSLSLPLARLGSPVDRLKGVVDEVVVWSRALSALEVQTNMNRLLPGPLPDLVAYWRFNEGSGTNAEDVGGQGHVGALTNGVRWVRSRAPDWPVTSANMVGLVNLTLPEGEQSLIANPFNNGNNSLDTIFPLPDGTYGSEIQSFSQGFSHVIEYFENNIWFTSNPDPSYLIIPPGEGFFFRPKRASAQALNVTLVGEVPEGHLVTPLLKAPRSTYLSSKAPQARRIGAAGVAGTMQLPVNIGDTVSVFKAQGAFEVYTYDRPFGWSPGNANGPLIEVGAGFILKRKIGPPVTWTRDFTVSSVTGPTLQAALLGKSDGPVRITWDEPGWIPEQADDPEGPWTPLSGYPTSPYQFQPPVGGKKFYRLVLPPRLCVVNGEVFGPLSPLHEKMFVSWADPAFKLQTTGKLAVNPDETVWADLSTNRYAYFSLANGGPDACGNWNGISVVIDTRNRGISNSPAAPAEFFVSLDAAQAGVTNSSGRGFGTISLATTNGTDYAVAVDIRFSDLSSKFVNARIIGPAGKGGGTNLFLLPISGPSPRTNGVISLTRTLGGNAGGLGFTVAQQLEHLRSGQWAISIISQSHLNGEIRGQIFLKQQFFRLVPQ